MKLKVQRKEVQALKKTFSIKTALKKVLNLQIP